VKETIRNIEILQRKLVGLKDTVSRKKISPGQSMFMDTYLHVVSEYLDRSLDLMDENKYREALLEIED
jgi:hypothetical protein